MRSFLLLCLVAAPLAAQDRTSLLKADRALAGAVRHAGLKVGLSPALTDDAVLVYTGAPVVIGKASIDRLLRAQAALDSVTISWTSLNGWVSAGHDFGVTMGRIALGTGRPAGSYLAGWRFAGKRWRVAAFYLGGVTPANQTTLPSDIASLAWSLLAPVGPLAAMVQADLDFAALAGKSGAPEAFRFYAAPDALLLGAAPRRGPAEIAAALASGPQSDWSWFPVVARGAVLGDLGVTVGESIIRPGDGTPASYGKYLTVWRRQADGSIRFLSDGGNPRPTR